MELLDEETIISETDFEHLTLTTHRVRYDQRTSDATRIVSITLDAVSSCSVASKSHPILLLLAVAALLLGVFLLNTGTEESNIPNGLIIASIVLAIAYFLTRVVALSISSPGEAITVVAKGLEPDTIIRFIDAVEQAKLQYLGKAGPVSVVATEESPTKGG
jgi:hypothetical protein